MSTIDERLLEALTNLSSKVNTLSDLFDAHVNSTVNANITQVANSNILSRNDLGVNTNNFTDVIWTDNPLGIS